MKVFTLLEEFDGRVLLADDDPSIIELYSRVLAKHGINYITASDGQNAWEIFQTADDIPVVITDVEMPRMTGIKLVGNILNKSPLTQIIIVTGVLDDAIAMHGMKRNVVCLPKPIEPGFIVFAVAGSYKRFKDQAWEDELRAITKNPQWNEAEILAWLEKAPWLQEQV